MSFGIRRFSLHEDFDAVLATLLHAFMPQDFGRWITPDDSQRRLELTRCFSDYLNKPESEVLIEVTSDLSAVAIWELPGTRPPRRVDTVDDESTNEHGCMVRRFFSAVDQASPDLTVHWYLANLASRGGGGGAALVRHRANLLFGSRVPFCVFTGTRSNVSYYQHLGFDVSAEVVNMIQANPSSNVGVLGCPCDSGDFMPTTQLASPEFVESREMDKADEPHGWWLVFSYSSWCPATLDSDRDARRMPPS